MSKKAKSSARSKGFRKTEQKKPFLTKKEIIALVIILVAIVAAYILFNVFYDNGALKVDNEGAIVVENVENSVVQRVIGEEENEYFKVAEIGEMEGYTRTLSDVLTDKNIRSFVYKPTDEASLITNVTISGGSKDAYTTLQTAYITASNNGAVISTTEENFGGRTVYTMYSVSGYTNPETNVTTYMQELLGTTAAAKDGMSVLISVNVMFDIDGTLTPEEQTDIMQESMPSSTELFDAMALFAEALDTDF